MKAFVKLVVYIGFLFWGGGFLIAFSLFIAYNGLVPIFKYQEADQFTILYGDTTIMPARLVYEYEVNGEKYANYQNVSTDIARLNNFAGYSIVFNTTFPKLSMVKELKGREAKSWDYTTGMFVFGFFFLFIFFLYKFGDLDKWIGLYTRGEFVSSKKK